MSRTSCREMDQWEVFARVAVTTAMSAQEQGVATITKTRDQLSQEVTERIQHARRAAETLVEQGMIVMP